MATSAEKLAQYLDAKNYESSLSRDALSRVENENERLRGIMDAFGEPQPPEPEPGLLFRALDALDTPRQFLAGGAAKLAGLQDYKDLSFIEAAKQGTQKDITTSDFLREVGPFTGEGTGNSIARGVVGFVGDVLTDPMNWVLPFGAAKKIGSTGLKVNTKATLNAVIDGDIVAKNADELFSMAKKAAFSKEAANTLVESGFLKGSAQQALENPKMLEEAIARATKEAPDLIGQIELATTRAAEAPFNQLAVLDDAVKRRGAALSEAGLDAATELAPGVNKIVKDLGLAEGTTLTDLQGIIKKPRFSLSSPVAGLSSSFSRVPLLGSREIDVPFLSDASEVLYKKLGEGYYSAPVRIKNLIDAKAAANPESAMWSAAATIGRGLAAANDKVVGLLSPVSRRIAASGAVFGANAQANSIKEHELIKGVAAQDSVREATYLLKTPLASLANAPDKANTVLQDVYRSIQSAVGGGEVYDKAVSKLRSTYNLQTPGLGDEVVTALQNTENTFRSLLQKEIDAGIVGGDLADRHAQGLLEGYVYQFLTPAEGTEIAKGDMNSLVKRLVGDTKTPDFTMKRVFETAAHAKALGYKVNEDIFSSVAARIYQHKIVMGEKEFAERMAYQWALPKETYQKLSALAYGDVVKTQTAARNALKSMGIQMDPREGFGMMIGGKPFDYESYANMKNILTGASPSSNEELLKMGQIADDFQKKYYPSGFNFSPEEDKYFQGLDAGIKKQFALLGREGESLFARGGAAELSDLTKKKLKNLNSEEQQFWSGLLPKHFVQAFEESQTGIKSLKHQADILKKSKDPLAKNIGSVLSVADLHRRTMQKFITRPWPSYWIRNLGAAPFQGNVISTMSTIGDALNLPKHLAWRNALKKGRGLVTESGEVISNNTLMGELSGFNLRGHDNSIADVADNLHDWLLMQSDDAKLFKMAPDLSKLKGKELEKAKGLVGRLKVKAGGLPNWLENFGREAVYINLRMQGHSPSAAFQEMSKAMVDYARGKTAFESTWLNSGIFFYSFARGNASNMMTALMSKPGALTSQLHAINGVAEMLTDHNNYTPDEDIEQKLISFRSAQGIPRYLGNNPKTGMPVVMGSTGLPIEDYGKWLSIFPRSRNISSVGDIFTSGGEAIKNGIQTVLGQSNPVIKGVVESFISEKSSFFNQPLSAESLRKISSFERIAATTGAYDVMPVELWDTLDDTAKYMLKGRKNPDGTITIDKYAMALINGVLPPVTRLLSQVSALTDVEKSRSAKALRFLSGVNISDFDPEKSVAFGANATLKESLSEAGIPASKKKALARLAMQEQETEDDTNP